MTKVIAAIDNSVAARPVLATARALADLFGADVEALHVRVDGDRVAAGVAAAEGVPLREVSGDAVEELIEAGSEDDVVCAVIGARGTRLKRRALGETALAVAASLAKPVAIVPPDAAHAGRLRRVLVPLEGTASTSLAPRPVVDLAGDAALDVVVVHVLDEDSLPSFTDQPQHEEAAWADEFLARYCPWGVDSVQLEIRIGRREELVPAVAQDVDADLIALGWSRVLAADRAPVVHAALAGTVPVVLIPVEAPSRVRERARAGAAARAT
jgi:nucleotide-binding universal stress UspA family protein